MPCQYRNHGPVKGLELYFYEDTKHGFKGRICRRCLYKHLRQYRPNSPNMRHLLQTFPELAKEKTSL